MPRIGIRDCVKCKEEEETTQWELFNLKSDPGETKNLAKERSDI